MRKCVGGKMLNQSHKVSTNWSRVIVTINVCVITTHPPRLNKTSFDLFSPLQIIWHDGDITQPREWGHIQGCLWQRINPSQLLTCVKVAQKWRTAKNLGENGVLPRPRFSLYIYLHRICPFWPTQPSSNVWWVCERRICSDEPQRACTSCCYCTINLWCHPSPPPA